MDTVCDVHSGWGLPGRPEGQLHEDVVCADVQGGLGGFEDLSVDAAPPPGHWWGRPGLL